MGCNGSKSVTVLQTDEGAPSPSAPPADENNSRRVSVSASAPEESSRPESAGGSNTRPVTPQVVRPSTAFDVPLDEGVQGSAGIVKRHPPLRLQRLEEQQQQLPPLSLQELQEKQQEAENRRIQFLQLRAQSAKRKYALRNPSVPTSAENASEIGGDEESKEEEIPAMQI